VPKASRQDFTKVGFGFVCDCDACKFDYPTIPEIKKTASKVRGLRNLGAEIEITKVDPQNAKHFADKCVHMLNKSHQLGENPDLNVEVIVLRETMGLLLETTTFPTVKIQ
jgi:hypothetical protein